MIKNICTVALLVMLGTIGRADEVAPPTENTVNEQEVSEAQVLQALQLLAKAKVIVTSKDSDKLKLRQDVMDKLKADGKLESIYSSGSSFCY